MFRKSLLLLIVPLTLSCRQAPPIAPPAATLEVLAKVPVTAIAANDETFILSYKEILSLKEKKSIQLGMGQKPGGIALSPDKKIFFSDGNKVFVLSKGKKTVFAGTGTSFYPVGDGGPATSAQMNKPTGLVFDRAGNLYIADTGNHLIRKIDQKGIISTVAGNGLKGSAGDGGPAKKARLNEPQGLALGENDDIYFCDSGNHLIRKIDQKGNISTVAGNGNQGFSGDGGEARSASLNRPSTLIVRGKDLFFADEGNERIRWIDEYGRIATVAGNGQKGKAIKGPAKESPLDQPVLGGEDEIVLGDSNGVYRLVIR